MSRKPRDDAAEAGAQHSRGKAPGFFAQDPVSALRERQELASKDDTVFEAEPGNSDDSSSDSDADWGPRKNERPKFINSQNSYRDLEGVRKSVVKDDEAPKSIFSDITTKTVSDIAAIAGNLVDHQPVSYDTSRAVFENTSFGDEDDDDRADRIRVSSWSGGHGIHSSRLGHDQVGKRVEPAARKLRRIQAEVEALCAWSEARKAETEIRNYEPMVVAEASRLGEVSKEVAGLVRQAVAPRGASAVGSDTTASIGAVPPKELWLPPDDRAHVAGVQQLLEASRLPPSIGTQETREESTSSAGLSYQFEAVAAPNGGWLLAADLKTLRSLEERVRLLGDTLGSANQVDEGEDKSLSASVTSLHKRLQILQQVCDDSSCDQLRASVQLLSADIDVAAGEAKKLAALEAEERESDIASNLGGHNEDTPAMQASRLHERLAQLDGVASRVSFIEGKLKAQEKLAVEFGQFAQDLSNVEARMQHTHDLLKAASSATDRMHHSVKQTRAQFQKNVANLEEKLRVRLTGETTSAGTASTAPPAGL